MEKIKVFLADPQVLFREGIHFTLSGEEDFEVIGEATSNEEAFTFIEANPPGVAILNMKNGKLDGPTVTRRIKRTLPSVSVILVMDSEDEGMLFSAIKPTHRMPPGTAQSPETCGRHRLRGQLRPIPYLARL